MKKIIISIFLFLSFAINAKEDNNKRVIGLFNAGAGFFAQFRVMLNQIKWCLDNNLTPVIYWGPKCPYYVEGGYNGSTNAWEYYFEQPSNLRYKNGDTIFYKQQHPKFNPFDVENKNNCRCWDSSSIVSSKTWAHKLIKERIKVKPQIREKIDQFYNKHMKGKTVIGIHLRGTDKIKEAPPVNPETILNDAKKNKNAYFFIATDEEKLLNLAKQILKDKVIHYPSILSTDGKAIHLLRNHLSAKIGENILIEVILLSKCKKFYHTCSNVSLGVYLFNPDIEGFFYRCNEGLYHINKGKYDKIKKVRTF